jgi:hypothetical protein
MNIVHVYDHFLVSPDLAQQMADGGKLLEDCGIIALIHDKAMKKAVKSFITKRESGLSHYIANLPDEVEVEMEAYNKAVAAVKKGAVGDASYLVSDHRVIWIQFKVW